MENGGNLHIIFSIMEQDTEYFLSGLNLEIISMSDVSLQTLLPY